MTNLSTPTVDSLELSKMFHEINNPLTLINSSLQLIEQEHPEVREYRFWDQTIKDVQNLRTLIHELSDFQKGTVLNKRLINVFDFVEDLLETTEAFLLENGTPLTLESIREDVDFYGDEIKLRQAVINLLKNAAESSRPGTPIELCVTADDTSLFITVKDHGCGMSEELLASVFEPFHTTKPYGTGLGLPIVKRIILSHEGSISIDSKEGIGTSITLTLPLS